MLYSFQNPVRTSCDYGTHHRYDPMSEACRILTKDAHETFKRDKLSAIQYYDIEAIKHKLKENMPLFDDYTDSDDKNLILDELFLLSKLVETLYHVKKIPSETQSEYKQHYSDLLLLLLPKINQVYDARAEYIQDTPLLKSKLSDLLIKALHAYYHGAYELMNKSMLENAIQRITSIDKMVTLEETQNSRNAFQNKLRLKSLSLLGKYAIRFAEGDLTNATSLSKEGIHFSKEHISLLTTEYFTFKRHLLKCNLATIRNEGQESLHGLKSEIWDLFDEMKKYHKENNYMFSERVISECIKLMYLTQLLITKNYGENDITRLQSTCRKFLNNRAENLNIQSENTRVLVIKTCNTVDREMNENDGIYKLAYQLTGSESEVPEVDLNPVTPESKPSPFKKK